MSEPTPPPDVPSELPVAPAAESDRTKAQSAKSRCGGWVADFGTVLLWLAAGVVVGVVAALPMGRCLDYFPVPEFSEDFMKRLPADPFAHFLPLDIVAETIAHQRVALFRNMALGFGICGAISLTAFGLLYGLALRRWIAVVRGLAGGVLIGGASGALGGALAATLQGRLEDLSVSDPLVWMSLSLGAAWVTLAVGCGVLSAWVAWDRRALLGAAFAAIAAGLIAAILYLPTATMLFQLEQLDRLIPVSFANRAYGVSLATGLMALALGRTLVRRKRVR